MSKPQTTPDPNRSKFWDQAYLEERDHWDMGSPTPVFMSLLNDNREALELLRSSGNRMLVPGCGRGYDAMLFAEHGFDVTAVDFAGEAMDFLHKEIQDRGLSITTLQQDIFTLDHSHDAAFDEVLEYTCFCALDPARRGEYYDLVARVLKPGGLYIGLLFPIDGRPGGPPFNVPVHSFTEEMSKRFDLLLSEIPTTSVSPRLAKEQLMIWQRKQSG